MLVRRFISRENADGADNLINPINLSEAIAFSARGCCALAAGGCNRGAVNVSDNQMARDVLRRSAEGA